MSLRPGMVEHRSVKGLEEWKNWKKAKSHKEGHREIKKIDQLTFLCSISRIKAAGLLSCFLFQFSVSLVVLPLFTIGVSQFLIKAPSA